MILLKKLAALFKRPQNDSSIVLLGDSIFARCDWSRLLPFAVSNHGVSGETTAQILIRAKQIASTHPHAVFVSGGFNDEAHDVPLETIKWNYTEIIKVLHPARICFFAS